MTDAMIIRVASDAIAVLSAVSAIAATRIAQVFASPSLEPRLSMAMAIQYTALALLSAMMVTYAVVSGLGLNYDAMLYPIHAVIALMQTGSLVYLQRVFFAYLP